MGFMVDKVALWQVLLRVPRLYPVNIIPPKLHTPSTRCSYQDSRTKRWNLPKSSALSANGKNWIEKYFHLVSKWLNWKKCRNVFPVYCNTILR